MFRRSEVRNRWPSASEQPVVPSLHPALMLVTVGICTWNRAALLARCLDELTRLATPLGVEWELLVVNNNSTDDTDAVLADFARRLPLRRLFERTPGKSHALNLAVREARGSYIVWTDDDALPDPHWLACYCAGFARWPNAAVFGGPVEPWFPAPPPPWLLAIWPKIAAAYATVDFGGEPLPLNEQRVPYGVNMAVRTDYQRSYLYDPDRGPRPDYVLRGEETEVVRKMLRDGAEGWWVPSARVRHFIPPERQTLAYLRRYYEGYGRYLSRFTSDTTSPRWFGRPRWLWRKALTHELRFRVGRLTNRPSRWIDDLIEASMAWGGLRTYQS